MKTTKFPTIEKLLFHIFREQYDNEMILDYLTICLRDPEQKLPALFLVSEKENTGINPFLYLIEKLFGGDFTFIIPESLERQYNRHWITKKMIVIDDDKLKLTHYEIIKSLITTIEVAVNDKNKEMYYHPFSGTLIVCLQYLNERIDKSRSWIRVTQEIKNPDFRLLSKINTEIEAFSEFLQTRPIKRHKSLDSRLYFDMLDGSPIDLPF